MFYILLIYFIPVQLYIKRVNGETRYDDIVRLSNHILSERTKSPFDILVIP